MTTIRKDRRCYPPEKGAGGAKVSPGHAYPPGRQQIAGPVADPQETHSDARRSFSEDPATHPFVRPH